MWGEVVWCAAGGTCPKTPTAEPRVVWCGVRLGVGCCGGVCSGGLADRGDERDLPISDETFSR